MFRIRRIHDDVLPGNRRAIARVQQQLREQFGGVRPEAIDALPEQLRDPVSHRLRTVVLVAESAEDVRGFAIILHAPDLSFCYLDFISSSPHESGRGVGGALYERVREECRVLGATGLFFECLPDDLENVSDPASVPQNQARLRFYERFGARPIIGTGYETPVRPGDRDLPHLVFDDLGTREPLTRKDARAIVRAILERKYAWLCPPEYIDLVVNSFRDNPVKLRPFRYVKAHKSLKVDGSLPDDERILLVVNQGHDILHARERGHAEAPVHIPTIRNELTKLRLFEIKRPRAFPDSHVSAVHDPKLLAYLKRICGTLKQGKSVYPNVFPLRGEVQAPTDLSVRAGYYCVDTFTPLHQNAWLAARRAVDCALTGAAALVSGRRAAYALVRPPGHHAGRRSFGGFSYLNSAAIAAHYLSRHGRVALLDLDYHHGNGHQEIFWERSDVLTVSIHGHPRFAYPYFSGFADERGAGPGYGSNINLPLPEHVEGPTYLKYVDKALSAVKQFEPSALVVSLGFDTGSGDPTGTWSLAAGDFEKMGKALGCTGLPILVVQEGGYRTRSLGRFARAFFVGLAQGIAAAGAARTPRRRERSERPA